MVGRSVGRSVNWQQNIFRVGPMHKEKISLLYPQTVDSARDDTSFSQKFLTFLFYRKV